ncbi:MAG: large conductance mechanosensitive channel protein MscL [Clostridia bacterium]|nr:large conductance mechanosensitive channel protein MscL [Clostridia bacterium]
MKEKGKGLFAEFKEFISKGNAMALAIGVIIGGAFQKIVGSLVDDIIMPVISLITKGMDFTKLGIILGDNPNNLSVTEAKEAGIAVLAYGNLITAVINFLLIAVVIFLLMKAINSATDVAKKKLGKGEAEEEEPEPRVCPFCKSEIADDATRCPHCTSMLEDVDPEKE